MIVGITVVAETSFTIAPIEYLAEVVHPLAAVAWDRDMADAVIPDPISDPGNLLMGCALRFIVLGKGRAIAFGLVGVTLAQWDDAAACWKPTAASSVPGAPHAPAR